MNPTKYISLTTLFFCIAIFFYGAWLDKKWNDWRGYINWDTAGYYYWLPGFFYDDPGKLDNCIKLENQYHSFGGVFYGADKGPEKKYVFKYSYGNAFMYLPAFLFAHYWASLNNYAVDGFSFPYQFSLAMYSILVAGIGLFFLRKVLLLYFEDKIVAITIITVCLASNYFQYTSLNGAFTHNYLFTLYAILIYLVIKWYERPTYIDSFFIGCIIGLATVTRPTEIIIIIIPLLWGIDEIKKIKPRIVYLRQHYLKIITVLIPAAIFIFVQLLYWKIFSGSWLYWTYGNEGFDFLKPNFINGLISYRKGWLTYTPVMILGLIGFIWLYKFDKRIFVPAIIYFLLHFYITYSWKEWEYGGSFSQRAMIQTYVVLAFSLCCFWQFVFKQSLFIKTGSVFFLIFCIWFNMLLAWQSNAEAGFLDVGSMNKAYYWRIFGKTHIKRNDKKILDDVDEIPSSLETKLTPLPFSLPSSFYDSSCNVCPDRKGLMISGNQQSYPRLNIPIKELHASWLRAYITVFTNNLEWDMWSQTEMHVDLKKENKTIKEKFFRLQRIMDENQWQQVFIDIENEDADSISIHFWQPKGIKRVYIDTISVSYIRDEIKK